MRQCVAAVRAQRLQVARQGRGIARHVQDPAHRNVAQGSDCARPAARTGRIEDDRGLTLAPAVPDAIQCAGQNAFRGADAAFTGQAAPLLVVELRCTQRLLVGIDQQSVLDSIPGGQGKRTGARVGVHQKGRRLRAKPRRRRRGKLAGDCRIHLPETAERNADRSPQYLLMEPGDA